MISPLPWFEGYAGPKSLVWVCGEFVARLTYHVRQPDGKLTTLELETRGATTTEAVTRLKEQFDALERHE